MRTLARRTFAVTATLLLTAASGTQLARADDIDEGLRFRSVLLQVNPLGFAIGRYSADLEYLPQPHHALHLTPVGYLAVPGVADLFQGFGAEVGYRWYSGAAGPQGLFLGASFLACDCHYTHTTPDPSAIDIGEDVQFVSLGGAIDAGFQVVVLGNFAAGIGGGVQYTADTSQPHFEYEQHSLHELLYGPGLRPRALLSVGAAF